jgi:SAM-dependent methyltransferase
MPAAVAARQFEHPAEAWLSQDSVLNLFAQELVQCGDDIGRGFGQYGLHLRPCGRAPSALPGASVRTIVSVCRRGDGLAGDLRCHDDGLPVAAASISVAIVQHAIETSPTPAVLVEELARVLKPEGRALFLVLNPAGITRVRWLRQPLSAIAPRQLSAWARAAGLEPLSCRYVGAFWRTQDALLSESRAGVLTRRFLSSYVLVARRREPGLSMPPPHRGAVPLKPGMSAG